MATGEAEGMTRTESLSITKVKYRKLIEDSGVPSWDPDSLLQEPRPDGWSHPTPPPVPRTLVPFKEAFQTETPDPPRLGLTSQIRRPF